MKNIENCKHCGATNFRKSDFCSRVCYGKGEWHLKNPNYKYEYGKSPKNLAYKQQWEKENPDYNKIYVREHRKQRSEYQNKKYHSDINFKLRLRVSNGINDAIRNGLKTSSTEKLLGCKIYFFRSHLESQFFPCMNWDNFGEIWEIDHIKPCYSFKNLAWNPIEQKECFNWFNQRPLFKTTEIAKQYGYNNIIGNRNRKRTLDALESEI